MKNAQGKSDSAISMLCQHFRLAYEARDKDLLSTVMGIFSDLKISHVLLDVIQEEILMPTLPDFFSEERLASYNHDLDLVYADALKFYQTDVKILDDIVRNEKLNNMNILVNCFWVVVEMSIIHYIPAITSPANADVFFANYKASEKFVRALCQFNGITRPIFGYFPFSGHMERYNTSAYYEIRHQQASFRLDEALISPSNFSRIHDASTVLFGPHSKLRLVVSEVLCKEIEFLFGEKVFLTCLNHLFLKSAILLMGKYLTWTHGHAVRNEPTMLATLYKLVYILNDVNLVEKVIEISELNGKEEEIGIDLHAIDSTTLTSLKHLLRCRKSQLARTYKVVKGRLCKLLIDHVLKTLVEVKFTSRIFRGQNNRPPTTARNYVKHALLSLQEFHTRFLSTEGMSEVFMIIVLTVCAEYGNQIKAILNSMTQPEESLSHQESTGAAASRQNLEEVYTKLQIKLDIELFVSEIKRISDVDVECAFLTLNELAHSCEQ